MLFRITEGVSKEVLGCPEVYPSTISPGFLLQECGLIARNRFLRFVGADRATPTTYRTYADTAACSASTSIMICVSATMPM